MKEDKNKNYILMKILDGIYFGFGMILIFSFLFGLVFASGFHTPNEIISGTFLGKMIFVDEVKFENNTIFNDSVIFNGVNMTPNDNNIINLDNSMSADDIQSIIDKTSKFIPSGKSLTFQFGDGTYILNHKLTFDGFYGGGVLNIQGNRSESNFNSLHLTQEVFLDFSAQDSNGISVKNSDKIIITNLRIKSKTDATWQYCVISENVKNLRLYFNYFEGTSTSYGGGVIIDSGFGYVRQNYFSNTNRGINSGDASSVYSYNNLHTGTIPAYGIYARSASNIGTYGTYPYGSSSNSYADSGGQVIIG